MSIKVFLDNTDITADLNAQYHLPANTNSGIYPDRSRSRWWDLIPAINAHPELRNTFFNNDIGIHSLKIQDTGGSTFTARILLRMKYTSRNR